MNESDDIVKELVKDVETLPALPEIYLQVKEALINPNASLGDVANLVQKDVAISAKILQVVNSAFFGLRQEIPTIQQAVIYLGAETIKSLIIMADAFDQFSQDEIQKFSIQSMYNHSIAVANLSGLIMKSKTSEKSVAEVAIMAGMLHDIGKLVLIRAQTDAYYEVVQKAFETKTLMHVLEKEVLGVTHAQVGAFLMQEWGLPEEVAFALRYHHDPFKAFKNGFDAAGAVFIANNLFHLCDSEKEGRKPHEADLDKAPIDRLGLRQWVPQWQEITEKMLSVSESD